MYLYVMNMGLSYAEVLDIVAESMFNDAVKSVDAISTGPYSLTIRALSSARRRR